MHTSYAMAASSPAHRVASGFPNSRPHSSLFTATSVCDSARQPRDMQRQARDILRGPRDIQRESRDMQCEYTARLRVEPNLAPHATLQMPDSNMSRNLSSGRDGADSDKTDESDDELRTPLFAHESFALGQDSPDDECCHVTVKSPLKKSPSCLVEIDANDPTLEKFPTEPLSVLSTLRKIQSCHDDNLAHVDRRQSSAADAVDAGRRSSSQALPKRGGKRVSQSAVPLPTSCSVLGAIAEEPKAIGENDHGHQDGKCKAAMHQGQRHSCEATDSGIRNPSDGYSEASVTDERKP